jgi:hypothetical protein
MNWVIDGSIQLSIGVILEASSPTILFSTSTATRNGLPRSLVACLDQFFLSHWDWLRNGDNLDGDFRYSYWGVGDLDDLLIGAFDLHSIFSLCLWLDSGL